MLRRSFLLTPLVLAQEPEPIRVEVNLVNLPFSAQDEEGLWVTDLKADELEVLEDGIPQKLSFFSRASDSALSIGVVADASGSQDEFLKEHRRDLRSFLQTVLRPTDSALLVCFGNYIRMVSGPEKEAKRLDEALQAYQRGKKLDQFPSLGAPERRSGGTAFYDAIILTARELRRLEGRRAILLFSDGEDNASAMNLMDAVEEVQALGVTVFSMRYTETRKGVWSARNKYGLSVMRRLADESGGLDFDAGSDRSLEQAFARIGEMLRTSYDLAYTSSQPERDGTFRKIRIRAKRPGVKLRHKTGYYARPS